MGDAPERIWAWRFTGEQNKGGWLTAEVQHAEAEYVRADLASPAPSLPEDVERVVERLKLRSCAAEQECRADDAAVMTDADALIQSLSSQLAEANERYAREAHAKMVALEQLAKARAERDEAETIGSGWEERFLAMQAERDEARKVANLGCDANGGGSHTIIKQGNYAFCAGCGETVKHPPLSERCRKAEADRNRLAAENERLRAPVGGPVPTDQCEFHIGQPVRLAEPYAGDDPNLVYFVTGIRWEHRPVPARGWDITIATAEELAKGHGQTDGFAPSDLRAALAPLEDRG